MNNKISINSSEISVLKQLDINSRTPLSRISKKIRKSQQRVSYNVNALIKKGIIKRFYTLVDYSKLNVISFRVYFNINYTTEGKFKKLIDYLMTRNDTGWICSCGATYDLICTFFARNVSRFNKNIREIISLYPDLIRDFTILTTIVIRKFERKYLSATPTFNEIFVGGDRKPQTIDDTDLKILDILSENARISSVDIGRKLSITPKTVISRIKKLQQRNIIKGYMPLLDIRHMGNQTSLLLIKYHNISVKLEEKLIKYLKVHPNVINVVKTLGEWDIEVEIEVKGTEILRKIEIEIRKKFTEIIKDIISIPLYENFKKNFFPRFLLQEVNK